MYLQLRTAAPLSKHTVEFYPHRTELSKSTGKVVPVFREAPRRAVYGGTEVWLHAFFASTLNEE